MAKKRKSLVFVDFGAHWCPGCVRLDSETFPSKEFAEVTKNLVKVRVDVDQFAHFPLVESYRINGIPAMLIMDANGEEIDRLVDFQPMDRIRQFVRGVEADPVTMKDLTAKASDSESKRRLGVRLLSSGRAVDSLKYLEGLNPAPPELLQARIDATRERKAPVPDQVKVLREAIAAEPESLRSLLWRAEIADQLGAKTVEAQAVRAEGVRVADELLRDAKKRTEALKPDGAGEMTGYEKFLVAMTKGEMLEGGGDSEAAKIAFIDATRIGREEGLPPDRPGPALRYLIILTVAERFDEANEWADRMLKSDPKSFEIRRRKAKILLSLKKYPEAEKLAREIRGRGEGRNEFGVLAILSKSLLGQGSMKSKEAERILKDALARPEMQDPKMESTKKDFEESLKKAQATN